MPRLIKLLTLLWTVTWNEIFSTCEDKDQTQTSDMVQPPLSSFRPFFWWKAWLRECLTGWLYLGSTLLVMFSVGSGVDLGELEMEPDRLG